jgi:hypothetical protein
MRERYLDVFDRIWIDNLHGDRIISEYAPDGRSSETVFAIRGASPGIKVGTAIALLARKEPHEDGAELRYRDLDQAGAEQRRAALLKSLKTDAFNQQYEVLHPLPELGYPFKPKKAGENYLNWPKLTDLFPAYYPGVKTSRDAALVEIDRETLVRRMERYFDPDVSDEEIAHTAPALMSSTRSFNAPNVRRHLINRKAGFLRENIVRYCYRPFDLRWLYWEPETNLLDRERADYFAQVFEGNVWIEARQRESASEFSRGCFVRRLADNLGNGLSSYFPLYLKETGLFAALETEPQPNLTKDTRAYLDRLGADPADLFYHTLAILHAPAYRVENAGALRQDWPRVPLPAGPETLHASAALGRRVAALLDVERDVPGVTAGDLPPALRAIAPITHVAGQPLDPARGDLALTAGWGYPGRGGITMPGQGTLAAVEDDDTGAGEPAYDVYLNDLAYWHNVPADVWAYTLGGYPVLKKWLSYRERRVLGRDLTPAEARTFTAIARRIAAILGIHDALDANYGDVKRETGNVIGGTSNG